MDPLVLTIIGDDRSGLVAALSDVVDDHGGSWERSHVTELAGVFAGVVLVRLPAEKADGFRDALGPLREQGLDVTVRSATAREEDEVPTVRFEVVGADRPGIVREVSRQLAALDVSIVDMQTATESAAMAGSPLFRATATVRLPDGVTRADVVSSLEDLSSELMVDVAED